MSNASAVGSVMHFSDERIEQVLAGDPLTAQEREFLVTDTPRFEECDISAATIRTYSDADLVRYCYGVWSDYARGQA